MPKSACSCVVDIRNWIGAQSAGGSNCHFVLVGPEGFRIRVVLNTSNCVLKFTQLGAGVNENENVNMNENDPVSMCHVLHSTRLLVAAWPVQHRR